VIVRLTAREDGFESHMIEADDIASFDLYTDPPHHDEPWPWLGAAEAEAARATVAARVVAVTVLTGQGADELLDTGPYHIAERLRRGRILAAWSEAGRCARAEGCNIWSMFYPFGLLPLMPAWSHDGPRAALRGGRLGWMDLGETTIPPWICPQFAARHDLRGRALAAARRPYHLCIYVHISVAIDRIAGRAGDAGRWALTTPLGVHVAHPFLDPRLLCFLLSVHSRNDPPPRGTPKPLLGEAMRGVLPEEIRTRPKSGGS
jgi:asparagine synthase (glutamine-hydrolysing)